MLVSMLKALAAEVFAVAVLLMCAPPALAQAPDAYRLQPGDVIDFDVAALPNLHRQMRVSTEGRINVPLVGWIDAGNHTLAEVEEAVRAAIPDAVYRERVNGDELMIVVRADEIFMEISEYRPVYVTGEVASSGSQNFRPQMTVRQAIAVAGGLRPAAATLSDAQLARIAELKSRYGALMSNYIAAVTDAARLTTEMEGGETVAPEILTSYDLTEETQAQVLAVAQKQLAAQTGLLEGERAYLQAAIQQNGQRVSVLREQQRQEQEGVDSDRAELNRIEGLAGQGAVQAVRVTEARRQLLLTSTRALETKANLATAEIRQADLARQLQRLDEERQLAALADLQIANRQASSLHAELEGMAEQIVLNTPAAAPGGEPAVSFTIFRNDGVQVKGTQADLELELHPGDVVEVYGVVLTRVAAAGTP
jgi:polysaccharide export outer membrane protein